MNKPLKHTPGPWVVDSRGGCLAIYQKARENETPGVHKNDSRNIHYSNRGATYVDGHWTMDEQARADAFLMAAAPDLLACAEKAEAAAEHWLAKWKDAEAEVARREKKAQLAQKVWGNAGVRAQKAEADRDKWMGQFDEAEHRGLAYMEERDKLESMFAGLTDWINVEARECGVAEAKRPNNSELRSVIRGIVDRLRGQTDKLAAKLKEYEAFNEPLKRVYNENTAEEATP